MSRPSPTKHSARRQPARSLDLVDKLTLPLFAVTMLAEARALRDRPKRQIGDLLTADAETLSGSQLPADALVPLGYERKDTVASLSMLAGNIAFGFVTAGLFARFDRFLFKHRVANLGTKRCSLAAAMLAWDFLYYWDHRWMV